MKKIVELTPQEQMNPTGTLIKPSVSEIRTLSDLDTVLRDEIGNYVSDGFTLELSIEYGITRVKEILMSTLLEERDIIKRENVVNTLMPDVYALAKRIEVEYGSNKER